MAYGAPKLLSKREVDNQDASRYYRVKVSGDLAEPLISVRGKIEPDAAIREIMASYDKLRREFKTRKKLLS